MACCVVFDSLRLFLGQSLKKRHHRWNVCSMTDRSVRPSHQCAPHTIWGPFAVACLEVVPCAHLESFLEYFCGKQKQVPSLLVLGTGAVTQKMHFGDIGPFLPDQAQHWLEMLPDSRWALQARWGNRAEEKGSLLPTHIAHSSVGHCLLVGGTPVYCLYLRVVFTTVVLCKIYVHNTLACWEVLFESS